MVTISECIPQVTVLFYREPILRSPPFCYYTLFFCFHGTELSFPFRYIVLSFYAIYIYIYAIGNYYQNTVNSISGAETSMVPTIIRKYNDNKEN